MVNDLRYVVYAGSDQEFVAQRRSDVRLQGLGACLDQAAADDHSDLRDLRTTEECGGLDQGASEQESLSRSLGNFAMCPWIFLLGRTSLLPTLYYVLYTS